MDDYRLEEEENRAAAANQHDGSGGSGELSIHQHMQIAKSVARVDAGCTREAVRSERNWSDDDRTHPASLPRLCPGRVQTQRRTGSSAGRHGRLTATSNLSCTAAPLLFAC